MEPPEANEEPLEADEEPPGENEKEAPEADEEAPEADEEPPPGEHRKAPWRDRGDIDLDKRPVFDQKHLVCCSPIAVLEACELTYHIEQNKRPPGLSLQHLVNQIPEKYLSECRGKTNLDILSCQAHTALKYIKKFGVCTKSALKFKWCRNKKKPKKTGTWMRIRDFEKFEFNEKPADYTLNLINEHPIVGEMLCHPSFAGHQGDGIFMDPSNQPNAPKPVCAHAVVIIDYGTEDGVDFYIIKNSYGEEWGIRGIGRVERSLFIRYAVPIKPYIEKIGGKRKKRT